jgi:hypothetical protein
MGSKDIISQIDVLLNEFNRAKAASPYDDLSGGLSMDEHVAIYTRMRAGIERLAPTGSSYFNSLIEVNNIKCNACIKIIHCAGILQAMKADYSAGYLQKIEGLIQANMFENFLEMADELLAKKYKEPAAVVAGCALEEHIRKLAHNSSITVLDAKSKRRQFNLLTVDLVKSGLFSETQRKILAGWYGIRSSAAHGDYDNVIKEDVEHMIQGIREFMIRFTA